MSEPKIDIPASNSQGLRALFLPVLATGLSLVLLAIGWKRKVVQANLALAEPWLAAHKSLLPPHPFSKFYRNLLRNLSWDVARLLLGSMPARQVTTTTQEQLSALRGGGLLLCAHYGNFEMMGAWLLELGIPLRAAHLPLRAPWAERLLARLRHRRGSYTADYFGHPRQMLRDMQKGNLVAFLADQDERTPSALNSDFLGLPVRCSPLPDWLQSHSGKACWFGCIHKSPGTQNQWTLHIERAPTDQPLLSSYHQWLEARIQQDIECWYGWTHRRFLSLTR